MPKISDVQPVIRHIESRLGQNPAQVENSLVVCPVLVTIKTLISAINNSHHDLQPYKLQLLEHVASNLHRLNQTKSPMCTVNIVQFCN